MGWVVKWWEWELEKGNEEEGRELEGSEDRKKGKSSLPYGENGWEDC